VVDLYQDSQRLKDAILDDNLAYLTFNLFELFTGLFLLKQPFGCEQKTRFIRPQVLASISYVSQYLYTGLWSNLCVFGAR
jgi:hypothetical protein